MRRQPVTVPNFVPETTTKRHLRPVPPALLAMSNTRPHASRPVGAWVEYRGLCQQGWHTDYRLSEPSVHSTSASTRRSGLDLALKTGHSRRNVDSGALMFPIMFPILPQTHRPTAASLCWAASSTPPRLMQAVGTTQDRVLLNHRCCGQPHGDVRIPAVAPCRCR